MDEERQPAATSREEPHHLEAPGCNYRHGGWTPGVGFFDGAASPVSASRTYDIFNDNGWGRSLHFLAGWGLVLPGVVYLAAGIARGHLTDGRP